MKTRLRSKGTMTCCTECLKEGIRREAIGRGLCAKHYARLRKHGSVEGKLATGTHSKLCESCLRQDVPEVRKAQKDHMCPKHYQRWLKHGDTVTVLPPVKQHRLVCACGRKTSCVDGMCPSCRRKAVYAYRKAHQLCVTCGNASPTGTMCRLCRIAIRESNKRSKSRVDTITN